MLMTPMAIAKMAKMAISTIIATNVMANVNLIMAIRGIQLKSIKTSPVMMDSYESNLVILSFFMQVEQCKKGRFLEVNFAKIGKF